MIIDEGHRAKNTATKLRKALKQFKVTNSKIILTGTPVQNNLNEFFSIIDLVQDNLFGTEAEFKRNYAGPIQKGMQKNAKYR
jgi:DNA repair and recombination protein RAD54B